MHFIFASHGAAHPFFTAVSLTITYQTGIINKYITILCICARAAGGSAGKLERGFGMGQTIAQKIIAAHLVDGKMEPGCEVGLRIDQTLTQDATGTMAYLEYLSLIHI